MRRPPQLPAPPPRKRLGQHFLTDPRILDRIAQAVAPREGETVVEIGPGRGALTAALLRHAERVVAIELDRDLVALLRERFADECRFTVVEGDVLATPLAALADGAQFVVAGNVPYNITTPILFHALRQPRPSRMVFLVQREVAERLAAAPGSREYGALSVNAQALARVELLFGISPGAFQPPPAVDSTVVRLTPRSEPEIGPALEERFRRFVVAAFGLRRKQMLRVLRTMTGMDAGAAARMLARCEIDPKSRAETLSPAQFATLVQALAEDGSREIRGQSEP